MPPHLSSSSSSHLTHSLLNLPVKPHHNLPVALTQKHKQIMLLTSKKLIPILVFVLTIFSVVRLLKITITTSSLPTACSSTSPHCSDITITPRKFSSSSSTALTKQEFKFLSQIISGRAPCNLLVFGIQDQYLKFQSINTRGTTVFLEDNPENLSTIGTNCNNTRAYRVKYKDRAKDGYKLLKHARENPDCFPRLNLEEASTCKLALKGLPEEVNRLKWDVVVVDGPSSDRSEAPGRMAAIYTAGIIARRGNFTDVVVHDVDRTIEKWFSWEFLCENNLVSSKGKFWNFRIGSQQSNSTSFCADN